MEVDVDGHECVDVSCLHKRVMTDRQYGKLIVTFWPLLYPYFVLSKDPSHPRFGGKKRGTYVLSQFGGKKGNIEHCSSTSSTCIVRGDGDSGISASSTPLETRSSTGLNYSEYHSC